MFFLFSLRVSVETHLRLFKEERRLNRKNQLLTFPQGRVLSILVLLLVRKKKDRYQGKSPQNFVLKTCLRLFTKLLFNAYTILVLLYINKSLKILDRKQKCTSTKRILILTCMLCSIYHQHLLLQQKFEENGNSCIYKHNNNSNVQISLSFQSLLALCRLFGRFFRSLLGCRLLGRGFLRRLFRLWL